MKDLPQIYCMCKWIWDKYKVNQIKAKQNHNEGGKE